MKGAQDDLAFNDVKESQLKEKFEGSTRLRA